MTGLEQDLIDRLRAIEILTAPGPGQITIGVLHTVVVNWLEQVDKDSANANEEGK